MCEKYIVLWVQHFAAACPCVITPRLREALRSVEVNLWEDLILHSKPPVRPTSSDKICDQH